MRKTFLGLVSSGAFVLASAPAFADDVKIEAGVGHEAAPGAEKKEHEEKAESEEHQGVVAADFVLGFGKVAVPVSNPSTTAQPQPGAHEGAGQVTSESLVVGGMVELLPHTSFGARIPLSFATITEDGGPDRTTNSVGNLELLAGYERHVTKNLALVLEMGVSLPTASGQEIPEDVDRIPPSQLAMSAYDKGAINRAASLARGAEDTALFAMDRLGANPQVGAIYTLGKLSVAGTVKMENLFATTSLSEKYIGELVPKARVAYRVQQHIEPAVAVWAPIVYAGAEPGEDQVGLVVEPQLVGYVGPLRPTLGVLLPVAGPASDPTTVGVRLALAAVF